MWRYQMTNFADTFKCNYPIAAMAMNKVSDLKLAVAVRRAGGLPSLSIYNYYTAPEVVSAELLKADLEGYIQECGDACILMSTGVDQLLNDEIFDLLIKNQIAAIELILDTKYESRLSKDRDKKRDMRVAQLRESGTLVFVKALGHEDIIPGIDGAVIKGPDGAGRGNEVGTTLRELFDQFKAQYPTIKIIVAGGIGTAAQVKEYIDSGAFAVGIGTLFAASQESKVSHETKLKMVSAGANDIKKLSNGAVQNALVFKEVEHDNFNNTRGLMAGIKNPESGHIFAGKGIEHVTGIKPVEQIVQELIKDL